MTKHRKIITPELHLQLSFTPGSYSDYTLRRNRKVTPGGRWTTPGETQDAAIKRYMRAIKSAQTSGINYAPDFPFFYNGMKTRDYISMFLCGRLLDPEDDLPFDMRHLDLERLGDRPAPMELPEVEPEQQLAA